MFLDCMSSTVPRNWIGTSDVDIALYTRKDTSTTYAGAINLGKQFSSACSLRFSIWNSVRRTWRSLAFASPK